MCLRDLTLRNRNFQEWHSLPCRRELAPKDPTDEWHALCIQGNFTWKDQNWWECVQGISLLQTGASEWLVLCIQGPSHRQELVSYMLSFLPETSLSLANGTDFPFISGTSKRFALSIQGTSLLLTETSKNDSPCWGWKLTSDVPFVKGLQSYESELTGVICPWYPDNFTLMDGNWREWFALISGVFHSKKLGMAGFALGTSLLPTWTSESNLLLVSGGTSLLRTEGDLPFYFRGFHTYIPELTWWVICPWFLRVFTLRIRTLRGWISLCVQWL